MSRMLPGIGAHHSARRETDEWLTPRQLVADLGAFDLDPCSPIDRPWPTAARHLTVEDDGLTHDWAGRVWLNPPYSDVEPWMRRLVRHGNGIALVFARTETSWWFEHVWPHADLLLFLRGRVSFCRPDGRPAGHNAGGPSVLIAYGDRNARALRLASCGRIAGALVEVERTS